jgi:hypothetical protein
MATIPLTPTQISDFISDGILTLPAGNFSVSSTIDFGTANINGIRLQGAGQSYATTETANDYQVTRLYWTGTPGEPMIKGHIRHGVFEDIQLLDARVHIDPKSGWGTGLCQFNRVSFHGADGGVLFGGSYNGNAADSRFRDCQWNQCEACIETTSSQNVNYGVSDCIFYRVDTIFKIEGGGLCNVDNCYLTQVPVVFTVTGDGSGTAVQNGNFSVTNLRYDDSQDVKPKLVLDTGSYGTGRVLSVLNVHESSTWGLDLVDTANATWTIKGLEVTEVEIMSATPIVGQGYTFSVTLFSQTTGEPIAGPTIESADFEVSTDGGAFAALATAPTVTPAGGYNVEISLNSSEVGTSNHTVKMVDASGAEWKTIVYHETVADADNYKADIGSLNNFDPSSDTVALVDTTNNLTNQPAGGGLSSAPLTISIQETEHRIELS